LRTFAFIIHPLSVNDVARKYPVARFLPLSLVEAFLKAKSPMVLSEIKGVRSLTGEGLKGWFIGCPLTPRQLSGGVPLELVYQRLQESCEIAHRQGAEIIGLGAFTAVAGDGGITVAKRSPIPVTTGNSYTVATAIEGTLDACKQVGIEASSSTLAVVGATGSIGKTCARILSATFERVILIGRDPSRTRDLAEEIPHSEPTTDLERLVQADAVITVTSSDAAIIQPHHLKTGSVVCDVARPRDVSAKVVGQRPDVLLIEGGVVSVPGDVDFGMDFGFPPKTAYACMCETMMLALEGRLENYTLGKDVSVEQVKETQGWANKHGFKLAGYRSFQRAVSQEDIARVRAARAAAIPSPVSLREKSSPLRP